MSSFLSSVYECYELPLRAKILRGAVLEEACDRKVSLKLNTSEVLFMSNHVLHPHTERNSLICSKTCMLFNTVSVLLPAVSC